MSNPLDKPPFNLTEDQLKAAIAWAWIKHPEYMYEGLKLAFNLSPKEGETVQ